MPTSPVDGQSLLGWGIGIIAGVLALFKTGKNLMKSNDSDKLISTAVNSDITSYKRLLEEIERLSNELTVMRSRTGALERKLELLWGIELDGATDLGLLTAYVQAMPCGQCNAPAGTFNHMTIVLERMANRKKERNAVFTGADEEQV
jgi:hypothetical protein